VSQYSNYKSGVGAPAPPLVFAGSSVPFSFTQTTCGGNFTNKFYCWIDFNHDGDFLDAGENVYTQTSTTSGNHTETGFITIPIPTTLGITAMRIVNAEGSITGPCASYGYGETEDYLIDIQYPFCNAPPVPGLTLSNVTTACAGGSVNLSLLNAISNPSIAYQWQSANDAAFTTNVLALGTAITQTTTVTANTYYRCIVTCVPSGNFGISTPVFISLNTDPCACAAYCIPSTPSGCDEHITNVTFAGINNNSGCGYPYENFTGVGGGALIAGTTLPLTYTFTPYYSGDEVNVFFDWNHDGDFTDPNEVYTTDNLATGSGSIAVPCNALGGPTRMRIRLAYSAVTWSACGSLDYSEAEDYCINVTPAPCTNTLNLKCYIQCFYVGAGMMNSVLSNQGLPNPITDCDDVLVELHDATAPYAMAYSFTGVLHTDGTIACTFPAATLGNSYYISVKHRNAVQTWSANPVPITTVTAYDFSAPTVPLGPDDKSFGPNQFEVEPGVWAFYSGDINQDDAIDGFDYILQDPDIILGASGYLSTDLTGDGNVDAFDYICLDPNIIAGITIVTP
jgi:GEVED domain